ncbi:MAG: DUF2905 domain-containing protein [Candidatus Calescibacterium sp.]|nr:DUF2905 domain-containing protein [Candidatus Calescibacterium sp.]MCX7972811.1 DUF2905 domain-containing protein [bacterium]MDW8195201.1 DUF2905 domain-containing protein [Candidatus Calescibacterium sp.]
MKQIEFIGLVLIITGVLLFMLPKFFNIFGKLPGDISYSKDNFTFFFPITTSIVISIILSIFLTIVLNIWGRR